MLGNTEGSQRHREYCNSNFHYAAGVSSAAGAASAGASAAGASAAAFAASAAAAFSASAFAFASTSAAAAFSLRVSLSAFLRAFCGLPSALGFWVRPRSARMRATRSEGCAPTENQCFARSWFTTRRSALSFGRRGLKVPKRSMKSPSRGLRLSATTIR